MEHALKAKLERSSTLPTLPAVALKVLELCQRENLDLSEIARVIANDPALAAKMLKTVNSPAFALRQEVRTLSHAVALLGVNSVRNLVLSFSLLRDVRRSQRSALNTYWRRSVLAGASARELAVTLGFPYREEAFLAGLLQDIGMLALRQLGDPVYNDLLEAAAYDHERVSAGELAAFESDHAEVGAWLIGRWRLPERFRMAVGFSHKPWRLEQDADPDLATLVRITAVSGPVADIWIRPDASGAAQRAHIEAVKILRIPGFSLEDVVRNMASSLPEISSLFEIELGSADQMSDILSKAQEALAVASVGGMPARSPAPPPISSPPVLTVVPPPPPEPRAQNAPAEHDPITRLPDRASAEAYLTNQFTLAGEQEQPLTMIVGSIDRWDDLRKTHGAAGANDILRSVAACLTARMRRRDIVARSGEGEFTMVLPETTSAGALAVAERAREQVASHEHTIGNGPSIRVTLSFGCATFTAGVCATAADLAALANRALAAGKKLGHNRTTVHSPGPGAAVWVARRS